MENKKFNLRKKLINQKLSGSLIIVILAIVGIRILTQSHAESPYVMTEAELGTLTSPATEINDSTASGGAAVQFGSDSNTVASANFPKGYQGIYQFTGTPQFNNQNLKGGVLIIPWNTVEPTQGQFDWSSVDSQIAPWVAAGKKVAIRVQANELCDTDTPRWVFANNAVPEYQVPETSGNCAAPQFWNANYLADVKQLAQAFAQKYNGDPNVSWVQATVGVYSETKVDTDNSDAANSFWDQQGYNDNLWFQTVKTITGYYQQYFTKTPLAVSIDKTFIDGNAGLDADSMVSWLTSIGVAPQDDGLRQTTVYSSAWSGPHISEQFLSTSSTGDSLAGDFKAAMAGNPTYILIYGSDIENAANQSILAQYAQ
jgi:hypothetical protein